MPELLDTCQPRQKFCGECGQPLLQVAAPGLLHTGEAAASRVDALMLGAAMLLEELLGLGFTSS